MYLVYLEAHNFLSFEKLAYNFTNTAKVIQGENLDDDDQEANGVGKSAIFYILEYLLTASTSKAGVDGDLVRIGTDKAYAYLEIYCNKRKQTLQIERNINALPKLALNLINDDGSREQLEFSGVPDGNKQLLNWIGISKDDLQNYYLISTKRYRSFMTSPDSAKMEMISRLVNFQLLENYKPVIENEIKVQQTKYRSTELNKAGVEASLLSSMETLENELNRDFNLELEQAKENLSKDINKITETIAIVENLKIPEIDSKIEQYEQDKNQLIKTITLKESALKDAVNSELDGIISGIGLKVASCSKKIDIFTLKVNQNIVNKKEALGLQAGIENILMGAVICPNCEHEFSTKDTSASIEEERLQLEKINELISNFDKLLTNLDKQKESTKNEIELLNIEQGKYKRQLIEQENELRKNTLELKHLNTELKNISNYILNELRERKQQEDFITSSTNNISGLKKQLSGLKIQNNKSYVKELKAKIKAFKLEVESIDTELLNIQDEINSLSRWEFNFKKFQSTTAKESLAVFESQQNRILADMKSTLRIKWEGFKMNADGSISDKFTPTVIRNSIEKPFGFYSGGERGRIEYSSILTGQHLINSVHPYGGLHFLMTDEVVEGIDSLGLSNIINSLNQLNMTILITTHVINRSTDANVLLVRKQFGKSLIIENNE